MEDAKDSSKYNWTGYPQIEKLLMKLRKNSYNSIEVPFKSLVKDLIGDVEEFILQGLKNGFFHKGNIDYVINKLNVIPYINVLPEGLRGIYGRALFSGEIQINPHFNRSATLNERQRQRLYMFHELGHQVLDIVDNEISLQFGASFYNTMKSRDSSFNDETYQEPVPMVDYGWWLLEEALTQEMAETLVYSSINKQRPPKQVVKDKSVLGDLEFKSNFDYYGIFQPMATMFGRTIRGVGTTLDYSEERIMSDLVKKSISSNFVNDVIAEYSVNATLYKDLYDTMYFMGNILTSKYASFGCPLTNSRSNSETNAKVYNAIETLTMKNIDYRSAIALPSPKFIEDSTVTR